MRIRWLICWTNGVSSEHGFSENRVFFTEAIMLKWVLYFCVQASESPCKGGVPFLKSQWIEKTGSSSGWLSEVYVSTLSSFQFLSLFDHRNRICTVKRIMLCFSVSWRCSCLGVGCKRLLQLLPNIFIDEQHTVSDPLILQCLISLFYTEQNTDFESYTLQFVCLRNSVWNFCPSLFDYIKN